MTGVQTCALPISIGRDLLRGRDASHALYRCLIVKTDGYNREQIAKVVQLRANVEGLKLGPGVLERMAEEGERGSMRFVISIS